MRRQRLQTGGSLFEVLVSVLMLGLGILGVTAVQTAALRNARESFEFSQAARLAESMLEIMRSQRLDALYSHGFVCDAQAGGAIGRWMRDVQQALGETACGEIACETGAAWCKVSIRWGTATNTGESISHLFTTGARL